MVDKEEQTLFAHQAKPLYHKPLHKIRIKSFVYFLWQKSTAHSLSISPKLVLCMKSWAKKNLIKPKIFSFNQQRSNLPSTKIALSKAMEKFIIWEERKLPKPLTINSFFSFKEKDMLISLL